MMIHPFPGAVPLSESRNRNPGDPVFFLNLWNWTPGKETHHLLSGEWCDEQTGMYI